VGRRIAESGTGVLVKRADLGVERLRSAVHEARGLRVTGRVSGGPAAFADAALEMIEGFRSPVLASSDLRATIQART
jgi:hypothetical protein